MIFKLAFTTNAMTLDFLLLLISPSWVAIVLDSHAIYI